MTKFSLSTSRSLFSRCVEPDEVGKIFSAVAIITAVAPLASNIAMRKLYRDGGQKGGP